MAIHPELTAREAEARRVRLAILPYVSGPGWMELRTKAADNGTLKNLKPSPMIYEAQRRVRARLWAKKAVQWCDPEYGGPDAWLPPVHWDTTRPPPKPLARTYGAR